MQDGPGGGVWGETADEIVYSGCGLVPIYAAGFLEDLGSRTELTCIYGLLTYLFYCTGQDFIKGFYRKVGSKGHQFIMHGPCIVIWQYGDTLLMDDIACIYFMLKEEGCYTGLLVSVYYCPVDWGGSSILRKEGGMQIEGTQTGHVPYYLREHTEGYYYLEVCFESP